MARGFNSYSAREGFLGKTTVFNSDIDAIEKEVAGLEKELASLRAQGNDIPSKVKIENLIPRLDKAESKLVMLRQDAQALAADAPVGSVRDAIQNKTAIGPLAGSMLKDISEGIGTVVMSSEDGASVYEQNIGEPVLDIINIIYDRGRALREWNGDQTLGDEPKAIATAYRNAIQTVSREVAIGGLSALGLGKDSISLINESFVTSKKEKDIVMRFAEAVAFALAGQKPFGYGDDGFLDKQYFFEDIKSVGKDIYSGTRIGADDRGGGNRQSKEQEPLNAFGNHLRYVADVVSKAYERKIEKEYNNKV